MSKSMITPKKQSKQSSSAWKPHNYQKKAVKFVLQNCCAGLLLDPGLGKTSIALAAIKVLLKEGVIDNALIVAPKRVCYLVWPKEQKKWIDFKDLDMTILHGKNKEKNLKANKDIYLINPEGLAWLLRHKSFKKKFARTALFVDESSKFKNTNSQRFKILRTCLHLFMRRYILTGSFAPNGLLDIFGQVFILDLGNALGRYITHFRNKYFYKTGYGGYEWRIQKGADVLIHERIRPLTMRLDAEDYLELPKVVINDIYLELPPEAQEIYSEMEDELYTAIKNKEVTAVNAAVATGKCAQIANGGIYDEDGKAHFIHDVKSEAVADLIDEINGIPALVAYEYGHDLERLLKALGKNTPYIGGGVSDKKSIEIEAAWNRGELPVLLGQPQSIAHGLNIQESGNHAIWHSLTWNFEDYDQFIRRLRRQGAAYDTVYVHRLIMKGTVDELKLMALNRKFRTQKDLLDALKSFIRKR